MAVANIRWYTVPLSVKSQLLTPTPPGEDNILIPPKFMPEVKTLPDDVLSFPKAIAKVGLLELNCSGGN